MKNIIEKQIEELQNEIKKLQYQLKLEKEQEKYEQFMLFYNQALEKQQADPEFISVSPMEIINGYKKGRKFLRYTYTQSFHFDKPFGTQKQKHTILIYLN